MQQEHKKSSVISKEALIEILQAASLSPSSHNTQPWKVHLLAEGSLLVGYRPERQLMVGDPNKRELFISLGCFIETIVLDAEDKGYGVVYNFLNSGPDYVARLEFVRKESSRKAQHWEKLIRSRRSDRRFYETTKLADRDIRSLDNLTCGDAYLLLLEQPSEIGFLSKMTREATYEIMSDQAFRNELASWVRNDWTKKPDGMPGYTQGMPGPISLLAKFVIKKSKKVAADQAKKDSKRVSRSAALGLICVPQESPGNWIEAGRLYQLICLEALHHDIKTSAVSAAVISQTTIKKIVKTLALQHHPVALMRFGHIDRAQKATPRLDVESFLY